MKEAGRSWVIRRFLNNVRKANKEEGGIEVLVTDTWEVSSVQKRVDSRDNVNPIKLARAALNLHPSISFFQLLILIRMKWMVPGAVAEGSIEGGVGLD